MKRLREWFPTGSLGCFYCGVDSKPILFFVIGLMGSLALASIFICLGFWLKGAFHNEDTKYSVFEAEQRG